MIQIESNGGRTHTKKNDSLREYWTKLENHPISLTLAGFVLTSVIIHLLVKVAKPLGLIDHPDARKQHLQSTPVVGGLGMYIALSLSLLIFDGFTDNLYKVSALVAVLVLVGAMDDRQHIAARYRFFVQVVLTIAMVNWTDIQIDDLGSIGGIALPLTLGVLAIPMTIIGTVGMINTINFSDGVDGLAGGLSLIALLFLLSIAWTHGNSILMAELALLSGILFGFLVFNGRYLGHKRAKVFMGDAGSMLLGFLLAWYFISMSQGSEKIMSPVTALWIIGLPLIDTVTTLLRRVMRGRSPFMPDREHLHHTLLHAGFSVCKTVSLILLSATAFGAIGIAGEYFNIPETVMFISFLSIFGIYFFATMHAWKVMKIIRRL